MIQFYAPDIEETGVLPESESGHCCRVLRMREGDEVYVVDGKGKRFRGVIVEAHPKRTAVELVSTEILPNHWDAEITLAVAPTKHSDRMEWLLEKIVEIGIDRVVLLKCRRSERKTMKVERLEKVMVSAMKQSLKGVLPEIEEVSDFRGFVDSVDDGIQKFFGYCDDSYPRNEFVACCEAGKPVVIMIGPEGDFSPDEVEYAVSKGFLPVTFGKSRLRTETAALYGVAAVHILNQMNVR
ncbi:MAG: 16S rRNA (uracil(1498)-N(3))-methyltransferase [Muribaculaceae bacterium]|nr:16S rRNA (uracil(1498)-N(3))-methyltransferase [Muribaculaceae bacterium]MDE6532633.1 16S rRNA (uracil(1498)-N(3))-methyltransferase [Muribaculaceae bacterium]